ncbi:uracil DNA glycosidase [Cricetid gammaherpesvirus 2]|uniref:Uracil DNA glycosidase n=1 Tax=Cricetid gammaherpesvirus 2 TaxID=1605972 RepID=E9M5M9_9GAMA|nr:uracil DNA glycosidase [Cricetid gammaherpesvirus 2]ADW24387.1 uracil DNA glycosidase [Cricetid gammaherpesvirus 2]ADW24469.1 uracil DNA glycosidase [Cricetid gammaherpesvirus 2]
MDRWLMKHVWTEDIDTGSKNNKTDLPTEWVKFLDLSTFFEQRLALVIKQVEERRKEHIIYPEKEAIFLWAKLCSPENIKVIILGQDPYHGGQASGLAFSIKPGNAIPPSLKNIFLELQASVPGFVSPRHGKLDDWGKRGVLLLNSVLTVDKGRPGSHYKLGWTWFTDYVISVLSKKLTGCVFMLWGNKAIEKEILINHSKHLVLKAQHPSPLAVVGSGSKQGPFSGCNHFCLANKFLAEVGKEPIDWTL